LHSAINKISHVSFFGGGEGRGRPGRRMKFSQHLYPNKGTTGAIQ